MAALAALRRPFTPDANRRTVFVLLGAALALSFALLDVTLIVLLLQGTGLPVAVTAALGVVIVVVPLVVLGSMPAVRQVEAVAAASLLGTEFPDGVPGAATTAPERRRSLGWFLLHVAAGAVAVVAVVVLFDAGLGLLSALARDEDGQPLAWLEWTGLRTAAGPADLWLVAVGLLLLAVPFAVVAVLGVLLGRTAPVLLGPSYDERLRRLEERTHRLVGRNRIAREIHDSVGHALSLVSVQAAAARTVMDRDPDFVRQALAAIERASRDAAADLDHVLGLLREDGETPPTAPAPDLGALDALVAASRSAGLEVTHSVEGDTTDIPTLVSREAYRILQEGLTNALRHSTDGTAVLRVVRGAATLALTVDNPGGPPSGRRGGRGLRGVEERVTTLGGEMAAGPTSSRTTCPGSSCRHRPRGTPPPTTSTCCARRCGASRSPASARCRRWTGPWSCCGPRSPRRPDGRRPASRRPPARHRHPSPTCTSCRPWSTGSARS